MKKVAIIGAGGNVGSAAAVWLASRKLANLVLVDINVERAKGRMEDYLQSTAYSQGWIQTSYYNQVEDIPSCDVVVITAGIPRKPGQSREDLIAQNEEIVFEICQKVRISSPNAILIVVSNPLDAMTRVAFKASGFPAHRVLGLSGCLDSARFQYQIASHLNISNEGIQAIVLGAHTDTHMVPIVSQARINGIPLSHIASPQVIQSIVEKTKTGGALLTQAIGTSAWLAPGAAAGVMVEAILTDSRRCLPCSVKSQGQYGLDKELFIGLPVQLGANGVEEILTLPLSTEEQNLIHEAANAIHNLCSYLKR